MEVKNRPIGEIIPYAANAKKHVKKQIEQVSKSIEAFGWAQPLVVDCDGNLIIGHCRLEAALKLGLKEVPTVTMADLSPEQVKALRLVELDPHYCDVIIKRWEDYTSRKAEKA
ncbi:MAG: ParB/Srx family N-terminal domain-containing protein [Bacteroidales bacterium]|jgi:ParB-like chromosome segregation protein Spo0J|nr:ParB/Srx family N-terminal domain-containing protein [Sphaerochaeta sp.]MCK9629315.1 ParB/Srx family N-terminal domain-containing protein [Bacteroidales bacterium]